MDSTPAMTTPFPSTSTTTTNTSSTSTTVTSTKLTLPVAVDGRYFRPLTINDNGEIEAVCVLCESVLTQRNGKLKKKSTIKASVKTNSNWLTHLKRKHGDNFPDYEKCPKAEEEKRRMKNQPKLPFKTTKTDKKAGQIESFILEYVIWYETPVNCGRGVLCQNGSRNCSSKWGRWFILSHEQKHPKRKDPC